MSTVLDPTINEIGWDDVQPPCEASNNDVPCPRSATWMAWNLSCNCDPEPAFCCDLHKEIVSAKIMVCPCGIPADLRWERL